MSRMCHDDAESMTDSPNLARETDGDSDTGHLRLPQMVGGTANQTKTWLPALGIVGLLSVFLAVLLSLKRRQR